MTDTVETDVLVIGGGGAGARAALSAAQSGARVMMALKGALGTSGATAYRVATIGGFQAATGAADPDDSPQEHFNDIMRNAQGMCNPRLAEIVATEAPRMLEDLIARGVELDVVDGKPVISTGCFASRPRMYWIRGHGHSIVGVLKPALETAGVEIRNRVMATSLLMADGACSGATLMDRDGHVTVVRAKATIMCTGGAARCFSVSLFPPEITGDGYALAFRAGARLANLEFIQCGFGIIHPITYLLSAHLWGLAPEILNNAGEAFLPRYLPEGLSAERCTVQRASHFPFSCRGPERFIDIAAHTELREGRGTARGGFLVDFRSSLPRMASLPRTSRLRWQYLREKLAKHGVDAETTPIDVSILAHAFNGGIVIDESSQSTIEGLYAAGETAAGPHGADRLGGNMLMTSQVFGRRAGEAAAKRARSISHAEVGEPAVDAEVRRLQALRRPGGTLRLKDLLERLQRSMTRVTIVRDEKSLRGCLDDLSEVEAGLADAAVSAPQDIWRVLELENLIQAGRLVVSAALMRRESRGSHYRADFPERDDASWGRSIASRLIDGRLEHELAAL